MGDSCVTAGCKYAWLYDRTRNICSNYGCLNNGIGKDTNGYWTSSATLTSPYLWGVLYVGTLFGHTAGDSSDYGIRPVITIPKSNIN